MPTARRKRAALKPSSSRRVSGARSKTPTATVQSSVKKRAKKAARSYSRKTLSLIWGLSGNQCAFPDCTNQLIVEGTAVSDPAIIGHICHIYAFSENGPRGRKGLTTEEKNSAPNLILMCGHHHPRIDKQYKDFPADTLIEWKRAHEARMQSGTAEAIKREADIEKHAFVQQMSDEEIGKALDRLRRARFLVGFSAQDEARRLAISVKASRFSGGSREMRGRALAWCARLLVGTPDASAFLALSKQLAATSESEIAQAFIIAPNDKNGALEILAKLSSAQARSAALRIVINAEGAKAAMDWCHSSGLAIGEFDAEGKFFYLSNALMARSWNVATDALSGINEHDYDECPVLLHAAAMTNLVVAIPEELRVEGMSQVPFYASRFELLSGTLELTARRRAMTLFAGVSAFAQDMGTAVAANVASDYALWLQLRDPTGRAAAIEALRQSMRDPTMCLRRVHLAAQFGVEFDPIAIEALIDRDMALTGKGTADAAYARFALAFLQGSPMGLAEYIDKHRTQLYEYLVKPSILGIEIEALAKAGLIDTAHERLTVAKAEGLTARNAEELARIIAEAGGADPIAERRSFYESTRDIPSLLNLVIALQEASLWQDLLPYARELFSRSRSALNAERIGVALDARGQYGELFEFLSGNQDLVEQSTGLQMLWAWTLYREGRFAEATLQVGAMSRTDPNVRTLRINIAIASGQWDQLVEFCNETWLERAEHSAVELLHAAQLSIAINGTHSRDLLDASVAKDPKNPHLLGAAYFEAIKGGLEQNEAVGQWLVKAARFSGDDGPLKSMSLKEIIDLKPEWDRKEANVWELLFTGKVPTFAAAQILNRSLIDFYLTPSLLNPTQNDVRRRGVIFSFSGKRVQTPSDNIKSIALDLAAIITLARIELLDTVIGHFGLLIPHSTLSQLFQERQKATFHQPSRIRNAKQIKELITNGTLKVENAGTSGDAKLIREIGPDLAGLLSSARSESERGRKTLVVHGSPLHRVDSVIGEPADISGYEHFVCSSFAVIERLRTKGALTGGEEERALSFLKLHESRWPHEPAIDDSTTVYLDRLALNHLQAAGVLEKFRIGGLSVYIANEADEEANALVALDSLGNRKLEIIEAIRTALSTGIEHGRVSAVRSLSSETDGDAAFRLHPTYSVLTLAAEADALVVDDRYINQHPNMTLDQRVTPVLSTLDLLEILKGRGILTAARAYEYRTILRQAGYQLIPVTDEELAHHLAGAKIRGGALSETAELRAIRESLMRARMSKLLQIPDEVPFLHQTLGSVIRAMKQKWMEAADFDEAKAFGDYLLPLANVRVWAGSAIPGNERGFAQITLGSYVLQMMSPPLGITDGGRRDAFYDWLTNALLRPLKENEPDVYQWIVARSKELAIHGTEHAIQDFRQHNAEIPKNLPASMLSISLRLVPPIVREELLSDRELAQRFGLTTEPIITLAPIGSFRRSALFAAVSKAANNPKKTVTVKDRDAGVWQMEALSKAARPSILMKKGDARARVDHLFLVTRNRQARLKMLQLELDKLQIAKQVAGKWRKLVRARPLSGEQMVELSNDLRFSPVSVSAAITDSLPKGSISFAELVPHSLAFYESLVGTWDGQKDVIQYATEVGVPFVRNLIRSGVPDGVGLALLLGSHSAFSKPIADAIEDERALTNILVWAKNTDILSQCAAIEVAFASSHIGAAVISALSGLISDFCERVDGGTDSSVELLSAAFRFTYGELADAKFMASKPVFWRRLAAFAQAAVISRSLKPLNVDVPVFAKWLTEARAHEFLLQCYVDMRTDPRWSAEYAWSNQLTQELGGRVLWAAGADVKRTSALGLKKKVLGKGRRSLMSRIDLLLAILPGPLDGNLPLRRELPAADLGKCRAELLCGAPKVEIFGPLLNAAQFCEIPDELPNLAADVLQRAHYRLDAGGDHKKLAGYLTGLAAVAAITRSRRLADELFVTIRNYRRQLKEELAVGTAFHIGLVACASRENFSDWAKCVGDFTLDLSYGDLNHKEGNTLSFLVIKLCGLVPELWAACSRGLAALEATAAA